MECNMEILKKPVSKIWSLPMIGGGVLFCILIRLWSFRLGLPIPDEIFTHLTIQGNLREILQISIMDVHPPLYYLMVKLWCWVFGNSLFTIRLFSFMFSILNILIIAMLLFELLSTDLNPVRRGFYVMGGLILSNHPWIVSLSSVARMYSLGNFLALSSSAILIHYYNKPGGKPQYFVPFLYGVVSGLLCLTHYFGAFVIVAQALVMGIMLLFRRPFQIRLFNPYLLSIASFIMVLSAWIPFAAQQVHDVHVNYWITEKGFDVYSVLLHIYFFSFPSPSIPLAVVGCIFFIMLLALASRNRDVNIYYAGIFVIPPVLLFAFSLYWRPLISAGTVRYFSFSLIFFGVAWGLIFSQWKNLIAAWLAIATIGSAQIISNYDRIRSGCIQAPTVEYQLAEWVKQEVGQDPRVLLLEYPPFFVSFAYYWGSPDHIEFPDNLFFLTNWRDDPGHNVHVACIPFNKMQSIPIDSTEFPGSYLVSPIPEPEGFIDQKTLRLERINEIKLNNQLFYLSRVELQNEG